MLMLVLAAIAGYGYVFTHGTCGIDDVAISVYFNSGLGVAIGRWPFYVINKVIPVVPYKPFIMDFVTVLLLMLAAMLWSGILRMAVGKEYPIWTYIVFSVVFLDYSIIAPVFVYYLQNGIGFVYILAALAVYGFYAYYSNDSLNTGNRIAINIGVMLSLYIAISFFESAANVFIVGAYAVVVLDLIWNNKLHAGGIKRFFQMSWYIVRYLCYAMVLRRVTRSVLMRVFSIQSHSFYRSVSMISWMENGSIQDILAMFGRILDDIWADYFAVSVKYYPMLLFVIATVVFVIVLIAFGILKKKISVLFYGLALYTSMFILCIVQYTALPYRACQHFTIFVGVAFWLAAAWLASGKRPIRYAGISAISLLLAVSVCDLNRWFVWDYENTQYDLACIADIAADLQSGQYDIEHKPIAFVGEYEGNPRREELAYSQMTSSLLNWGVDGLAGYCGYNSAMQMIFEQQGYEFKWVDDEQYQKIIYQYYSEFYMENFESYKTENYENGYPDEGYIEELDDYIVIKL
jgi:hypothetical protein